MIALSSVCAPHWTPSTDHRLSLDGREVEAIVAGLRAGRLSGEASPARSPRTLHKLARIIAGRLATGSGLAIVDGEGLDQLSDDQLVTIHRCVACLLGTPMPQNADHERMMIVRDRRLTSSAVARAAFTSERILLHTDGWDSLGLLCLDSAESGGASLFASAHAIHARLSRASPELLPLYAAPWHWNVAILSGNPDAAPLSSPIFAGTGDSLCCRYGAHMLRSAPDRTGVPLGPAQRDALDLFERIAHDDDVVIPHRLRRGQSVWLNNYRVLHGRDAFVDPADGSGAARRLVRLWVALAAPPILPPDFADFDAQVFGCPRGAPVRPSSAGDLAAAG